MSLLSPHNLREYQKKAIRFQCTNPHSMLWVYMGLGKTVCTLTTIDHLQKKKYLGPVLIVAPIRVARLVWRQEAVKWSHLRHLSFSLLLGTRDQRIRALMKPANIYVTNYENMGWLMETLALYFLKEKKPLPFNGLVWDEISKMKNSTTRRVKSAMKILPHFKWRTGLTGSPASNGYKDLHGQFLVVDGGQRLGIGKTKFKHRFYYKIDQFHEVAYNDTEEIIKNLIGDITLEMSAKDYAPLGEFVYNDIWVELPTKIRAMYDTAEKEFFIQLDNGEITIATVAVMINKCLQIANGNLYKEDGTFENLHDLKLEALSDIIDEAQGDQILCAYTFKSDAQQILKKTVALQPVNLTDCKSEKALSVAMDRWSKGDCPLMIGHPASMGHGIDGLQKNGHILVWFGLNWSLDLTDQMNARINRNGQTKPIICHRILCRNTFDEVVLERLNEKRETEESLKKAISSYRNKRGG